MSDLENVGLAAQVFRLANERTAEELVNQQRKYTELRALWHTGIRHRNQTGEQLRAMLQHGAHALHLEIAMLSRSEGDVMTISEVTGSDHGSSDKGKPTETISRAARSQGDIAAREDCRKGRDAEDFRSDLTVPVGSFITSSFRVLDTTYAITFFSRFHRPYPFAEHEFELMGMLTDYFSNFLESQHRLEQITRLAYHDQLTGLPNRAVFLDRAEEAISIAARYERECVLLYLDLDGFKLINDTLGHEAGDAALVEVGRRLRDILRREDFVARIGGDEFALLIPEIQNPGNPYEVIDRIRKIMLEPFVILGERFFLSVSIGAAMFPRDGTTHSELLAAADKSMYQDKHASPPERRMTPKRRATDLSVVM